MSAAPTVKDTGQKFTGTSMVRAASLEGVRNLLLELGVQPLPILEAAGLSNEVLNTPETMISTRSFRGVLNAAAEATGIRQFGLLLSNRQTIKKMGAVGYLVSHAPNLRISIHRLILHLTSHDTGTMSRLQSDGQMALWYHTLTGVENEWSVQQNELAVNLACGFIRDALEETWNPTTVFFEHSAPKDRKPYDAVFRCPVLFDQAVTGLEFPASDLDRPLLKSDPRLFAILEQHCQTLCAESPPDRVSQVRNLVLENIETGQFRIDDVAAFLGVKRYSLQRQLRAEGTSFQEILDDVRFEIARRHLRETDISISEIAGILSYAETAVFSRWFARRSGMAPRKWRQHNALTSTKAGGAAGN